MPDFLDESMTTPSVCKQQKLVQFLKHYVLFYQAVETSYLLKYSFFCVFSSKVRGPANHRKIVAVGLNVWVRSDQLSSKHPLHF